MNRSSFRRNGFSLIELVVVLLLTAMMAALASLSLRGVMARQRLARGIEIAEQFDAALRRSARRNRRSTVGLIDRGQQRFDVRHTKGSPQAFRLPTDVAIDAVRIGADGARGTASQIVAAGDGSTPSYALRITTGDAHRWVLFVGGSGQVVQGMERPSIDSLLGAR
ncbi:prepilin-type N-terminal cleavage/methylation domain-containing protein [Stieleria sp. TO1_6]|uniref:prepilin-type N-terminal cleavage/methylation domain-containing protein n=1 Tax=Stieleria tagensis TaxID=2956795 RepID=UPI00209AD955|nr:prepilin-type N-terminal cleavage/methylation domain-containing protein [Stieleria tagensis]MCO8121766.1 prepilin-type N-terminal cleavage/methylation domain-containing protein [Stieleria tagensis]